MKNENLLPASIQEKLSLIKKEVEVQLSSSNRDYLLEHFFNTNHLEYEEPENVKEFFDFLDGMGASRIIKRFESYKQALANELEAA